MKKTSFAFRLAALALAITATCAAPPSARGYAEEEGLDLRLRAERNPPSGVPEGDAERPEPNLDCRVTVRGASVALKYVKGTVLPAGFHAQFVAEEQPDGTMLVRSVTEEEVAAMVAALARRAEERRWPIPFFGQVRAHNLLNAELQQVARRIMEVQLAVRGDGHLLVRPDDYAGVRVGNGKARVDGAFPLENLSVRFNEQGLEQPFKIDFLSKDGETEATDARLICSYLP